MANGVASPSGRAELPRAAQSCLGVPVSRGLWKRTLRRRTLRRLYLHPEARVLPRGGGVRLAMLRAQLDVHDARLDVGGGEVLDVEQGEGVTLDGVEAVRGEGLEQVLLVCLDRGVGVPAWG